MPSDDCEKEGLLQLLLHPHRVEILPQLMAHLQEPAALPEAVLQMKPKALPVAGRNIDQQ
jgi:hypothetical protein